ncbi:unnamed protein product [Spodoptera exigua]|nr:unnamed protein product [Spodoptera exigua]
MALRRVVTNRADWKTGSLCRVDRACIATLYNIASKIRCSYPDERKEFYKFAAYFVCNREYYMEQAIHIKYCYRFYMLHVVPSPSKPYRDDISSRCELNTAASSTSIN